MSFLFRSALSAAAVATLLAAQDPLDPRDELLRWEGDRHGTLGPTGRRLFAARLEAAPGMRGRFGVGDLETALDDPILLEVRAGDRPAALELELEELTWFPSHQRAVWRAGELRVEERKAITAGDALLVRVELANESVEPLELSLHMTGDAAPFVDRSLSDHRRVDLSSAANVNPLAEYGLFRDTEIERVLGEPGLIELDGVPHRLADPGPEQRPTLIALRGGIEGDPARELPAIVELSLPDVGSARAELHLLTALAAHRGTGEGAPAHAALVFDDGSSVTVPWPRVEDVPAGVPSRRGEGVSLALGDSASRPRGDRVAWRATAVEGVPGPVLQLTYTPPPGRFLQRIEFVDGGGPEVPLVLAATVELLSATGRVPVLLGRRELPGVIVELALAGDGFVPEVDARGGRALVHHLSLEPGEVRRLHVGLQSGRRPFQTALAALALVEDPGAFDAHLVAWWRWFDEEVPEFTCSEPLLERAWLYRWFLLRHNMVRLGLPSFSLPVFYRGLSSAELCVVHPGATASVLAEARWLRDPEIALGQVRALLHWQPPDGPLPVVSLRRTGPPAPHRVPAAAWEAYLVNGSRSFLAEVTPLLERGLWGELARFDGDGDGLPAGPPAARASGLPPKCPHFGDGPGGAAERVELAAYAFASARALAAARRELGEPREAERLDALAEKIAAALLVQAWSEPDGRFRSLRESDGAPARCRELYDLFPFAAGLVPDEARYARALNALVDPVSLRTPTPFAAAARAPGEGAPCAGAWVHPAADTVAAEVLASALLRESPVPVVQADLGRFLRTFARLHFEGGDPARPVLRERYDPFSGLGAGEPDVLDSAFADLLIRFVGGLVPRADGVLELNPLVPDVDHFRFRRVPYRGHLLDIAWDRPGGSRAHPDAPEGYSVRIDGELSAHAPALECLEVELPPAD